MCDGSKIDMWDSKWISKPLSYKVTPLNGSLIPTKVANPIDNDACC